VVVDNLNIRRTQLRPDETHSILIVHANAVLPTPLLLQGYQLIPGRYPQDTQRTSGVDLYHELR
jgi:hypothetical protein